MRRREFISLLGSAAIALPLSRTDAAGVPTVGFIYPGPDAIAKERATHVMEGLRSEGFSAPDRLTLVIRAMGGDPARLQPLLSEIVASKVDILIPIGPPQTRAAHAATTGIPIVTFDLKIDPVEAGLVSSLPHPGGNVTGICLDFPSSARLGSGC